MCIAYIGERRDGYCACQRVWIGLNSDDTQCNALWVVRSSRPRPSHSLQHRRDSPIAHLQGRDPGSRLWYQARGLGRRWYEQSSTVWRDSGSSGNAVPDGVEGNMAVTRPFMCVITKGQTAVLMPLAATSRLASSTILTTSVTTTPTSIPGRARWRGIRATGSSSTPRPRASPCWVAPMAFSTRAASDSALQSALR
jgi:hypothetical protein